MRTTPFFTLAALGLALGSACDMPGDDSAAPSQEAADSDDGSTDADLPSDTAENDADTGDEVAPECENDQAATSEVIWLCIEGMV